MTLKRGEESRDELFASLTADLQEAFCAPPSSTAPRAESVAVTTTRAAAGIQSDTNASRVSQGDPAVEERLAEILDEYLRAAEAGMAPAPAAFADRYPEYREVLLEYLDGLALIQEGFPDFRHLLASLPQIDGAATSDRRLGDYQLLQEIGRGGMGIVYEARQISLQRRVALKILPFASMLDHRQVVRFQNEARAAAQLQHPHIVPVHCVGTDRGVHYYAMQYIEGVALSRIIENQRQEAKTPQSSRAHFQQSVEWARQAAEALHAAHECGVVHRDIKPSNLLIDGQKQLWVADFGLARSATDANVTHSGDLVGTLNYMSPEQTLGSATLVDHRTDIYSLGATLYELVTGRAAFESHDPALVPRQIQMGDFKRPRHWNPSVPVDLENVILKAMSASVQDRYSTAQELVNDLQRFLEELPTLARSIGWRKRAALWARRHRRVVIVSGVLGFATSLGILVSVGLLREQAAKTSQALDRFEEAKSAVHEVGSRAIEQLGDVPGTENVRRELLRDMLTYSRRFLEEASEQSNTTIDVAMTYTEMAQINQQLGDLDAALADYREAERLLNSGHSNDPRRGDRPTLVARCRNNMGLLLRSLGRLDEANRTLRESIASQRLASSSNSQSQVRELAHTWNNLGLVLADQGQRTEAEASYKRAIALLEQPVRENVNAPMHVQGADETWKKSLAVLATVYNNWSLLTDANLEEAIRLSKKAMLCQRSLLDEKPDLTKEDAKRAASDMANTCNSLASLCARNHNWKDAITYYDEAAEWQRQLVAAAPQLPHPRRDLAVTLNNMGLVQFSAEQWAAAEGHFKEAIQLQQKLVQEFPADLIHASRLGGLQNNLAMIHQQREEWNEAAKALEQGVRYQRYAAEGAPKNAEFRENLSRNYFNYARILLKMDRPEAALPIVLQRRQLWGGDPRQLYAIAKELTQIALCFHSSSKPDSRYNECVAHVLETLEQAKMAGWTLSAEQVDDVIWHHFANDPRFAKLVEDQNSVPETSIRP